MRDTSNFIWSTGLGASAITPTLAILMIAVTYPMYAAGWNYAADWTAYYSGTAMVVLLLAFTFIGVPTVAGRNNMGFWRGLLGVLAVIAWLALPFAGIVGVVASFVSYEVGPL